MPEDDSSDDEVSLAAFTTTSKRSSGVKKSPASGRKEASRQQQSSAPAPQATAPRNTTTAAASKGKAKPIGSMHLLWRKELDCPFSKRLHNHQVRGCAGCVRVTLLNINFKTFSPFQFATHVTCTAVHVQHTAYSIQE